MIHPQHFIVRSALSAAAICALAQSGAALAESTRAMGPLAKSSETAFAKFASEDALQAYLDNSLTAERIHPKLLWAIDVRKNLKRLEQQESFALVGNVIPNRKLQLPPVQEIPELKKAQPQTPFNFTEAVNFFGELDKKLWGVKRMNAPAAWATTEGEGVLVAVVDTGLDLVHPALKDNLFTNAAESEGKPGIDDDGNGYIDDKNGWNFEQNTANSQDDQGHGSHVGGTIAGILTEREFYGVAPKAKLLSVKTHDTSGASREDAVVKGILYAADAGAKVINCSWGGAPEAGEFSQLLLDAVEYAGKKNALVVAAAGNDGQDIDKRPSYPASYVTPNIMAVASTTSGDKLSGFSNYGAKSVHVAAPGSAVYSVRNGGGYVNLSGTSMAAPHASGAAALVYASLPANATPLEVKSVLMENSEKISSTTNKVISGLIDLSFLAEEK